MPRKLFNYYKSKRNFVLLCSEGSDPKGINLHDYITNDNRFASLVIHINFLVKYVNL